MADPVMALVMIVVGFAVMGAVVVIVQREMAKTMGDLLERMIQAYAIGGAPLSVTVGNQQRVSYPESAVGSGPKGQTTEEPGLPPLEQTIGRMAEYLEQQGREMGIPMSKAEAVAQARLMMADSGMLG